MLLMSDASDWVNWTRRWRVCSSTFSCSGDMEAMVKMAHSLFSRGFVFVLLAALRRIERIVCREGKLSMSYVSQNLFIFASWTKLLVFVNAGQDLFGLIRVYPITHSHSF